MDKIYRVLGEVYNLGFGPSCRWCRTTGHPWRTLVSPHILNSWPLRSRYYSYIFILVLAPETLLNHLNTLRLRAFRYFSQLLLLFNSKVQYITVCRLACVDFTARETLTFRRHLSATQSISHTCYTAVVPIY